MTARSYLIALALAALPAGAAEPPPISSFIADPPELKADPDRPGAYVWVSPDYRREDYGKVLFAPLTIYISPQSPEHGLDADALKELADQFRETLIRELEPEIPVVGKPGKDVLLLRGAISNLHLVKKSRGLLGYTPIGLIAHAARSESSKFSVRQAVIEVELLDSTTGRRLGVLVDRRPGQEDDKVMSWKEIGETLQFYAARFKERLMAAKAR